MKNEMMMLLYLLVGWSLPLLILVVAFVAIFVLRTFDPKPWSLKNLEGSY